MTARRRPASTLAPPARPAPAIPDIMTPETRAIEVMRIADTLQARLVGDLLMSSQNQIERNDMLAGVLALILRRLVRELPSYVDRQRWISEIVKAVFR